ncbi:MAG: carboxymuconolactone decarboxylase family protein [Rhodospirillales bacterium]|nr:carboxymuconolactone decarboxylase family protein [Rhodospirillales bacterium]
MPRIAPVAPHTASGKQKMAIDGLTKAWGQPWRVALTIANSPNLITAFRNYWDQLQQSSLTQDDREVIALYLAKYNGCHYCVPAHTLVSRDAGLDEEDIAAILDGREPSNPRRRLILEAVRSIQETKGGLSDAQFNKLTGAGLSHENLIDVIGEIAHCTVTNYTNRLAQTEPDDFLKTVPPAVKPKGIAEPEIKKYPLRPPKVG